MKIALCLYGQIDGTYVNWTKKSVTNQWRKSQPYISENIIEILRKDHILDIYFHAFTVDNIDNKDILAAYEPSDYIIEDRLEPLSKNIRSECLQLCLYTISKSLQLAFKENYDMYISCRFDYTPKSPIDITQCIDLNKNLYMVYKDPNKLLPQNYGNNHVVIGDKSIMETYANMTIGNCSSIHSLMREALGDKRVFKNFVIKGYIDKYPYNFGEK